MIVVDGVTWRVYELDRDPYDRRHSPSLVFETDAVMRKVRGYPAGWRDLTDTELLEISWRP